MGILERRKTIANILEMGKRSTVEERKSGPRALSVGQGIGNSLRWRTGGGSEHTLSIRKGKTSVKGREDFIFESGRERKKGIRHSQGGEASQVATLQRREEIKQPPSRRGNFPPLKSPGRQSSPPIPRIRRDQYVLVFISLPAEGKEGEKDRSKRKEGMTRPSSKYRTAISLQPIAST